PPRVRLRPARPAAERPRDPLRQGLLPSTVAVRRGTASPGWRTRHGARGPAVAQSVLSRAVRPRPAAVGRVRGAPASAGKRALLHWLRRGAWPAAGDFGSLWVARHRPGRPRHAGAPQPDAFRPVEDGVRHHPGGPQAPRGPAPHPPARGSQQNDEADPLRRRALLDRTKRNRGPGAPADELGPGILPGPPPRPNPRIIPSPLAEKG